MKRLSLLTASLLAAAPALQSQVFAPAPPPVESTDGVVRSEVPAGTLDAVRYVEFPDGRSELQTVILTLNGPAGVKVDLIAAVHIGDAEYYHALNERFRTYDVVLYELVGGPWQAEGRETSEEMAAIKMLQRMAKTFMGFEYQLDGIDYSAANFVHADVSTEELQTLFAERNETFMTLMARAAALEDNEKVMAEMEALNAEELTTNLLNSVLELNPTRFKQNLAPLLSNSEVFIEELEGDTGSVLISERNRVVVDGLFQEIDRGRKSIAVFYGAGHLPDLVKRLNSTGFSLAGEEWLPAWKIGATTDAPSSKVETVTNLLKDDGVVDSLLGLLRQLGDRLGPSAPPPDSGGQ